MRLKNNMWEKELQSAINAGLEAKKAILEIYNTNFDVEIKSDDSPVTLADKTADKIIRKLLKKDFPKYGFLTEESDDNLERLSNDYIWIVDPVDGTKDFVKKDDEFTTNIALCYKHEIVVGVILIPAKDEYYYAVKSLGSFRVKNGKTTKIHVNDKVDELTCLTSVFHTNEKELALIEKHKDRIVRSMKVGSSIKACKIAEGAAEITYRMSDQTKEWDTAACQIIVEEAGGLMLEPDGKRIMYNREDVYNRKGYLIINRKENMLL